MECTFDSCVYHSYIELYCFSIIGLSLYNIRFFIRQSEVILIEIDDSFHLSELFLNMIIRENMM